MPCKKRKNNAETDFKHDENQFDTTFIILFNGGLHVIGKIGATKSR